MSDSNLYVLYEDAIGELLEAARDFNRDWFERSLRVLEERTEVTFSDGTKHRFRIPDESPEMEIAQTFVAVQTYEKIVRDENTDKRIRAHLALMLSLHLLEADIWHTILGNLLSVVNGVCPSSRLFRGQCLEHKLKAMTELLARCKTKTLAINSVYRTLCNQDIIDLRNAFFHSQYLLVPNKGDVVLTKWLARKRPAWKKGQFLFSEIQDFFQQTLTFLTVLAQIRKEVLRNIRTRPK